MRVASEEIADALIHGRGPAVRVLDHQAAASVEPGGLERLIKYVRTLENAMGDGVKRVYDSEMAALKRLRRNHA